MKIYWDYSTFIVEETDRDLCDIIVCLHTTGEHDDTIGVGDTFYSLTSGNLFVTPA